MVQSHDASGKTGLDGATTKADKTAKGVRRLRKALESSREGGPVVEARQGSGRCGRIVQEGGQRKAGPGR